MRRNYAILCAVTLMTSITHGNTPGPPVSASDGDGILTVHYDPATGEISYDADEQDANSVSIKSATGIFTGAPPGFPANGTFNADADDEIGTASFTGPLPDLWSFGDVAQTNLTEGEPVAL